MAKFCTLASSSAGNSVYISAANTHILVDAGISCKRLTESLRMLECAPTDITAVLVTHEHIDHIKGLRLFLQRSGAALCAPEQVLQLLIEMDCVPAGTKLILADKTPFAVGNLTISAFSTRHDSVDRVGDCLTTPGEQSIAVATDLGGVTEEVVAGVQGCEFVYLESNYDANLLKMGRYPYFLKQRITSGLGHLENTQAAQFAQLLLEASTSRFVLGHLSKENNNPALAFQSVLDALRVKGAVQNEDFTLEVSPYDTMGKVLRF